MTLSLQARDYVGVEDPTQQSLQFVLESSAAAGGSAHGLPYLPTGNLVSGLPAALLSCCTVEYFWPILTCRDLKKIVNEAGKPFCPLIGP